MSSSHDLNIKNYKVEELFDLFNLPLKPTQEQMMKAKRKMLSFHPDKNPNIPVQYFLFYSEAYNIIEQYYKEQNRISRKWTEDDLVYKPIVKENNETIQQYLNQSSTTKNNKEFNEAYEKIVKGVAPVEPKNTWFSDEKPNIDCGNSSLSNFEHLREKTHAMVLHKDVQEYQYSANNAAAYENYDEEDNQNYISSDPFSKLRFDDLRKVHKDQTILPVGEKDFNNVKKYNSVDTYVYDRDIALQEAEKQRLSRQEEEKRLALKKEKEDIAFQTRLHASELKLRENENKSKEFSSYLMRLTDGH